MKYIYVVADNDYEDSGPPTCAFEFKQHAEKVAEQDQHVMEIPLYREVPEKRIRFQVWWFPKTNRLIMSHSDSFLDDTNAETFIEGHPPFDQEDGSYFLIRSFDIEDLFAQLGKLMNRSGETWRTST